MVETNRALLNKATVEIKERDGTHIGGDGDEGEESMR